MLSDRKHGGASRARTDDLIVANDAACRNHVIDSFRLSTIFDHSKPPIIGTIMGQSSGPTFSRTPIAFPALAAVLQARSERKCPSWSRCVSAAFGPAPISGRP